MSSSTVRSDGVRRIVVSRPLKPKSEGLVVLSQQREPFKIGDKVEFWSGSGSEKGIWKPGVIVDIACSHIPELCDNSRRISSSKFERIDVGNGICVIRLRSRVRRLGSS